MHPGQQCRRETQQPRSIFCRVGSGKFLSKPGAEAFVATIDGEPCGLVSFYPDTDYFTGHPGPTLTSRRRLEAERKGVGRAHGSVERWARDIGFVKSSSMSSRATRERSGFYERQGTGRSRPDGETTRLAGRRSGEGACLCSRAGVLPFQVGLTRQIDGRFRNHHARCHNGLQADAESFPHR